MKLLIDSKQLEEVGRGGVDRFTGFALPEVGCQVVAFNEDGALDNIKALCSTIQVKKTISQFKVGIEDGVSRIFIQHKGVRDVLWPVEVPENGYLY